MMQTITAANAKDELLDLLRATVREHKQYRIAFEEGGAILLSEETSPAAPTTMNENLACFGGY